MRSNPLMAVLWAMFFGLGIYLTVRYLWPLLLVIAAMFLFSYLRLRRSIRKEEEHMEQMEEQLYQRPREPTYQDELFQEQAQHLREEPGEIVDVEFTRKEENEKEGTMQ